MSKPFTKIPIDYIGSQTGLSGSDCWVLSVLIAVQYRSLNLGKPQFTCSNKWLLEKTKYKDKGELYKVLNKLETLGLIEITKKKGKSNLYKVSDDLLII